MGNFVLPNLWRFIGLVLVQALVLKAISVIGGTYFNIFIYPLFILFLPLEMATPLVVFLGFTIGLAVDLFYVTPGVHAAAGTFSGYLRGWLLAIFEPRGGYSGKEKMPNPTAMGTRTFFQVAAIFFFLHLFFYFSVDDFTVYYFGQVTLKSIVSWVLSMIFVVFYVVLFNPKS